MRAEVWAGVGVWACIPFTLVVASFMRVLPNLTETIGQVIIAVIPAMIVGGASLIWFGRKPDEQELSRKRDIHAAIKKWVELPTVKFRDRRDVLPLAEEPPELAVEIEQCLNRKYQSTIYASLQKFRQEYHEWKDTDSSVRFTKVENGKTIIDYRNVLRYDDSTCRNLLSLHDQLGKQIKSEIVDKHSTRLKC